jgi:DNA helicase-2/ATP-dependent DNA helicase PcrA
MVLVADLHIHSRFSRATSKSLDFISLHRAALEKGIGLVGTGDFTHPGWMAEINDQLEPAEEGWFRLRPQLARRAEEGLPGTCHGDVRFVLQVEISNIYKKHDRVRKNHNLVFVPDLDAARRFTDALGAIGNVASDGRPILGLDARDLLEIVLETDDQAFLVPAHVWTPWFSLFGSKSGFDTVEECFGDLSEHLFALETGLSSDPPMNWRLSALDRYTLVSSSDAHSAANLGREANIFDIAPGFAPMRRAIASGQGFVGTVEFFPEEGKYHFDGHRKCGLRLEPHDTRSLGGRCPTCGGLLTVGVMSRVTELADRPAGHRPPDAAPFEHLVPLAEVVGEVLGVGPRSKRVATEVERIRARLGSELRIMRELPLEEITTGGGAVLAEAVRRVRQGELEIAAGYDGEFGTVRIFAAGERDHLFGQLSLIETPPPARPRPRPSAEHNPASGRVAEPQPSPQPEHSRRPPPAAITLNPDQLTAAAATTGPLLVVAGPGTGKTHTLVARIAHQIRTGVARSAQVLAIAFTNQAADELRERIARTLPESAEEPPLVTTFHGLGLRLLGELETDAVEVVDDDGRLAAVRLAADGTGATSRSAQELLGRISLAKQECQPELAVASDPELAEVYRRYQDQLASRGQMDVDDLVLRTHRLRAEDHTLRARLADRFRSVNVDEYQDVNDVQAALVAQLSPAGTTLCAIGDPRQSIYGFRGARPGHFVRFEHSFPGARTICLRTSYRLTHQLAGAADALFAEPRTLLTERGGSPVELIACPSPEAEAEQILVRIERIVGGTSYFAVDSGRGGDAELDDVGFGDIAVLVRTRAQRREIITALGRSAVPCRSVGEDEAHDPRSEKVAVMTMHAAKGREFEVVFIAGAEAGLLPLDTHALHSDPDEERRLLYVALTRARRLAVISWAERRTLWGHRLPGEPSPFLDSLPAEHVVRTSPDLGPKPPPGKQMRLF